MAELRKLIESLRDILPNKFADEADPILRLRSYIERYLNRLDDNADLANSIQGMETHEAYVLCSLHLLNLLAHLDAPNDKVSPLFSVYQLQQISQCLEFVVCLGVYPLLSPGVSMPLELRLDNFDHFKCPSSKNHEVRIRILSQISNCFDGLLNSRIDTLKDLFSTNKFLGDYLAVLFQLGFGPFPRELLSSKSTLDLIRKSRVRLLNILNRLPRSLAFKQLFLFQSGFTRKKSSDKEVRAPKWLSSACGRLITRLFMAPSQSTTGRSALKDLIVGVVDVHSTDPRHVPAVASSLAHILATPPQACSSPDEYFNSLSFQITDVLSTCRTKPADSKDALLQITRLVAVNTIHVVCERDLELGKRLFLNELISKLNKVVSIDESDDIEIPSGVIDISDVEEILSAEDLFFVTNFISELLDTRHPSQALCNFLARYSQIWFHFCSLLNLASPGGIEEEKFEEECQVKEASDPSPVNEFRSILLSILSNHLLNPEISFRLIRGWIHLPPLDQSTLKPLSSSEINSLLIPLSASIILRPASLVVSNSLESSMSQAPFRVTRTAEPLFEHSLEMISARISTVIDLLTSQLNANVIGDESMGADEEQKLEEKAEQMLNTFTKGNQEEDSEKRPNLAAKLLLSLISDINSRVMGDINEENWNIQVVIQSTSFDNERAHQNFSISLSACLLAHSMLERLDPSNLWPSEPALAAQLISLTLSRLCAVIDVITEKQLLKIAEESLNLVLGIAAFFVNYMEMGDKVSTEVRNHFVELVPLMQRVESIFPESNASAELAQQIRIALCTRGAFPIPPQNPKPEPAPNKCLIEELSWTSSADNHSVSPSIPKTEMPPQLTEIFKLLSDPFIPVKGHALIELSRLLECKDSCIIGFEDKIYDILVEYMNHDDSYIYLNAIRGLSAIGNAFTDRLLPFFLHQFLNKSANVEFRLKIGEAIVRVLRELGEIAPKYRDPVVAGLITASKDDSEFIRAASLSNLAEICQLLGKSIQSVIYEVYNVMEHCLKHDSSALVRKSAAYLAGGLFRSGPAISRRDQLVRLPGEIVRDTHRLLRDRLIIERDELVLEQLEAAMFEVDACARETAFRPAAKPGDLIKEIRVLRPFDQ
nr:HEAT and Armadillo domain containing protein [Hymenolepis microstoma]